MASHTRSFFVLVLAVGFVLCVAGHGEPSASSIVDDFRFLFEAQRDLVETMRSKDGTGGVIALDRDRGSVVGIWDAVGRMHYQGRGLSRHERLLQQRPSSKDRGKVLGDDDGEDEYVEDIGVSGRRTLFIDDDGDEYENLPSGRKLSFLDDI